MDTLAQGSQIGTPKPRKRRRTIKERRDIVEETLVPGASVARVARRHDVNANQVFYLRKLYREGQLGLGLGTPLLPVKVEEERPAEAVKSDEPALSSGTIEIKVPRGTLRIAGSVDAVGKRIQLLGYNSLGV